jgi:hypothetical protein
MPRARACRFVHTLPQQVPVGRLDLGLTFVGDAGVALQRLRDADDRQRLPHTVRESKESEHVLGKLRGFPGVCGERRRTSSSSPRWPQ